MELKYIVMTIIKIVISVPAVLLLQSMEVNGAALMGGHLNNTSTNITTYLNDLTLDTSEEITSNDTGKENAVSPSTEETRLPVDESYEMEQSEEIPDPSPLVLPGYNLPENIFNKGKPFYLEKDPLTGQIDFDSKMSNVKLDDDLYDYVEDEPNSDMYNKANIDRKDGSLSSHRPSDVNQLTPNFHDFLNLPVKYNSDKYVYPLISSSYANTKIQGNVNKYQNHKIYNTKPSTYKPTVSPTYYLTTKYAKPQTTKHREYFSTTTVGTTAKVTEQHITNKQITTAKSTTTTKVPNLLNSPMIHPSFNEEFEEEYYDETPKPEPNDIHSTTKNINEIYITTKAPIIKMTSTKRPLSLFEQLFGDYDDTVATTEKTKLPSFTNPPSDVNKINIDKITNEQAANEKTSYSIPPKNNQSNSHAGPGMMSGVNNMELDNSYEYEDEYEMNNEDNIATETKLTENVNKNLETKQQTTTIKITTMEKQHPTSTIELQKTTTSYPKKENSKIKTTAPVVKQTSPVTQVTETSTVKVTSLPLGENHVSSLNNRQPIIVASQNLREHLNNEKVLPKPFGYDKTIIQNAPSTSNIHIAPNQDTVSFVVGHHQNVDGGQYVGTSLKESPYDSNPFRPFYGQQPQYNSDPSMSYTIQTSPEIYKPVPKFPEVAGSAVTIQPLKNSEASLAIGVPVNNIKQKPGQVVDEKLEIKNEQIEFPKGNRPKIVFPDERESAGSNLVPPPPNPQIITQTSIPSKSEVLNLNSKPVYHQLPSDLTPPKEQNLVPPPRIDRPRPPWDPRPGHFYSGKPEYARPPRPEIAYKRIDSLPNILPQFRPNMNIPHGPPHHYDNRLNRQPLLERPSNRPIGFFEKLQPPPPPKNLHNLRKIVGLQPNQNLDPSRHGPSQIAEDRIMNDPPHKSLAEQFGFYQTPPKIPIANRRTGDDEEVETLQMIQAKNAEKKNVTDTAVPDDIEEEKGDDKSLYVVYPVNTPPLKMDVIDNDKKEAVVIGTRAELPLPPSKINSQLNYDQNPILHPKDRNDSPILKPHPKPPTFPIKSDFPYPLERPDPSMLNPPVPELPSNNANNLDDTNQNYDIEPSYVSSNQWNTINENSDKPKVSTPPSQISVTLKTYTEKPIAVAYTPTEPHRQYPYIDDKYSMPNYGSPVIPEIRPGTVDSVVLEHRNPDNDELTVSAVMHTHSHTESQNRNNELYKHKIPEEEPIHSVYTNHRIDTDVSEVPTNLGFEAPFQASVNIDSSKLNGWSVVRGKKSSTTDNPEATTLPLATTSEFDIENFKPQLEGGFKPIYTFPNEVNKVKGSEVSDRLEK